MPAACRGNTGLKRDHLASAPGIRRALPLVQVRQDRVELRPSICSSISMTIAVANPWHDNQDMYQLLCDKP
jgi:hypothetical protein